MENTIQPTVGRIVHYYTYGSPILPDGTQKFKSEPRAAIVTAVHYQLPNENGVSAVESVDLCVLNPTGMFFNQNVKQGESGGQWDWMPFQKDQQARLQK